MDLKLAVPTWGGLPFQDANDSGLSMKQSTFGDISNNNSISRLDVLYGAYPTWWSIKDEVEDEVEDQMSEIVNLVKDVL